MNMAEFKAWKAETEKSRTEWRRDHVWADRGDLLLYKGGENGHFIMVDHKERPRYEGGRQMPRTNPQVVAMLGIYEGAIPHIGESAFFTEWCKEFETMEAATEYLASRGGLTILQEIMEKYS